MFDAGFWELLVIGVLALVVVGPERLPRLARTVGLWVGRARHAFYSVRDEIEREANAEGLRDTEKAIRRSMQDTEREIRSELDSVSEEADKAARSANDSTSTRDSKSEAGAGTGQETDRNGNEEDKAPPDTRHG